MCMTLTEEKILLKRQTFTLVCCSENCASYLTSNDPMPLEVDVRKESSRPLKILTISSNAMAFGIHNLKARVLIQVLRGEKSKLLILCVIRSATQQQVLKFNMTEDFQLVEGDDNNIDLLDEIKHSKVPAILNNYKEIILSYK